MNLYINVRDDWPFENDRGGNSRAVHTIYLMPTYTRGCQWLQKIKIKKAALKHKYRWVDGGKIKLTLCEL